MTTETLNPLAPYEPIRAQIEELKIANATTVFKYEDAKGNKLARSHVANLRTVKGDIERKRKELKADALEYGKKVDAAAKELTGEIEAMIDVHWKPLEAIERREAEAAAAVAAKAAAEAQAKQDAMAAELARLQAAEAERNAAATKEREAAERAKREDAIRAEAAAKAKREAEDAAMAAARQKEAETQAIIARERAATEKAKREAAEAESKAAREAKAKADAEAKRAADTRHRNKVIDEAVEALVKSTEIDRDDAKNVIAGIIAGEIPHVSFDF